MGKLHQKFSNPAYFWSMALSKATLDGGYRSYAVVFGLNVLGAHPEVVLEKERRVARRSCGLEGLSKSCHFRVVEYLKVPRFVVGGFEEGRLRGKVMGRPAVVHRLSSGTQLCFAGRPGSSCQMCRVVRCRDCWTFRSWSCLTKDSKVNSQVTLPDFFCIIYL